jgi:hypothetical protein
MRKQITSYVIQVWGTCIIVAPFLFTLIMIKDIVHMRNPLMEAVLVIGLTIVLGLIYFLPSLLITFIITRYIVKTGTTVLKVKTTVTLALLFLIGLESLYLYKNNLSLIYKGTTSMVLSYLILSCVVPRIYELAPADPDEF